MEENPDLSPSKIIQTKLYEIKFEEEKLKLRMKAAENKIFNLSGKLNRVLEYCASKEFNIPQDVLE